MAKRTEILDRIIIDKDDKVALGNRGAIDGAGALALNLIGSPGCGKTTLLEQTIAALHQPDEGAAPLAVGVIEGDVQTRLDADRIVKAGAEARQIETHGACRLDAAMVRNALADFPLDRIDVLFIENVGNLICPTGPKLGEHLKVAVLSVPEGDEKPAKYPAVFARSDAAVLTKIDLLPYLEFDLDRAVGDCKKINHKLKVFPLSARTGEGMDGWLGYLRELHRAHTAG
jgi:hydrogenase nickel incorporation protein HypB